MVLLESLETLSFKVPYKCIFRLTDIMEPLVEDQSKYPFWLLAVLFLCRCWFCVYDWLVDVPFQLFANPQKKLERSRRLKVLMLLTAYYSRNFLETEADFRLNRRKLGIRARHGAMWTVWTRGC